MSLPVTEHPATEYLASPILGWHASGMIAMRPDETGAEIRLVHTDGSVHPSNRPVLKVGRWGLHGSPSPMICVMMCRRHEGLRWMQRVLLAGGVSVNIGVKAGGPSNHAVSRRTALATLGHEDFEDVLAAWGQEIITGGMIPDLQAKVSAAAETAPGKTGRRKADDPVVGVKGALSRIARKLAEPDISSLAWSVDIGRSADDVVRALKSCDKIAHADFFDAAQSSVSAAARIRKACRLASASAWDIFASSLVEAAMLAYKVGEPTSGADLPPSLLPADARLGELLLQKLRAISGYTED